MKIIFSFLFAIVLLSSAFAGYNEGTTQTTCATHNNDNAACWAEPGCYVSSGMDNGCNQCSGPRDQYNPGCTSENCSVQTCESHSWSGNINNAIFPDGASSCDDWECAQGYTPIDTDDDGHFDTCSQCDATLPSNAHYVINGGQCTWICAAGYYKNSSNDGCEACPQHSTSAPGSVDISQCTCENGYYNSYDSSSCLECPGTEPTPYTDTTNISSCICTGSQTLINAGNDEWYCGDCDANANMVSQNNTCVCDIGYYMTNGTNQHCAQCGDHINNCNNAPGLTADTATCDDAYTKTLDSDGTVICTLCTCPTIPGNGSCSASVQNNSCNITYTCDAGYFYDSNSSGDPCQPCPYGKTSPQGSTGIGRCKMGPDTLFCDTNGDNCMTLIPSPTNNGGTNGDNGGGNSCDCSGSPQTVTTDCMTYCCSLNPNWSSSCNGINQ